MRLISQGGTYDVLYDSVYLILLTMGYQIVAVLPNNKMLVMAADYSSEEQFNAEVERLHKAYELMNASVFQFAEDWEKK